MVANIQAHYFMVDLAVKPATNVALVSIIVASSYLLARMRYLYLTLICFKITCSIHFKYWLHICASSYLEATNMGTKITEVAGFTP